MRTGLDAMLAELDPYTTFIDEAQSTDISIITRGQYGGVGLNVGTRGGKITVVSPIEGASGYKQGVRAGDVITEIDERSTADLTLDDVQGLMRGEPGTTVRLTVEREGEIEPLEFVLTRERVTLDNVTYSGFLPETDDAAIGYVKLERFAQEAGPEVRRAIAALDGERPLDGLVLDLRGNPGGLLSAAVDVTSLFVPKNSVVVTTRGRLAESERAYRSNRLPVVPDLSLVVLVNEFSASASEIVAGAVQDLDRGVVMGTTTYGKGLVQVVRDLPHNTAIKITTAKYYTPSGRSIQSIDYARRTADGDGTAVPDSLSRTFTTQGGRTVRDQHGIEPDVVVEDAPASELEEALRRKAAFFFFANHFAATRDTLTMDFAADDATLDAFRDWLETEDFDYRTDAERAVERLRAELAEDGYGEVDDEVDDLQAALRADKEAAFAEDAEALQRRLQEHILARFASEGQQIESALAYDAQARDAVALLLDSARYDGILTPQ
jgi:carboxyl-terminal processing protease